MSYADALETGWPMERIRLRAVTFSELFMGAPMSRLVLIIDDNDRVTPGVISRLSRLSGKSFLEIRKAITGHAPVLDKPVFGRLDFSAARDMLSLLTDLEKSNIPHRTYEIKEQDIYSDVDTYFPMNSAILSNMIACREKSLEQQRAIGRLEDPE
ncbi:MAG: hypothetical protein JF570_01175 [Caulobacter sp.]|nr:hypothetical protein [Caulobacter sp.]